MVLQDRFSLCSLGCPETMQTRLAQNSKNSTCLCLQSTEIKGVHHHGRLSKYIFFLFSKVSYDVLSKCSFGVGLYLPLSWVTWLNLSISLVILSINSGFPSSFQQIKSDSTLIFGSFFSLLSYSYQIKSLPWGYWIKGHRDAQLCSPCIYSFIKKQSLAGLLTYTLNDRIHRAEVGISLSSRPAWSHCESVKKKTENRKQTNKQKNPKALSRRPTNPHSLRHLHLEESGNNGIYKSVTGSHLVSWQGCLDCLPQLRASSAFLKDFNID